MRSSPHRSPRGASNLAEPRAGVKPAAPALPPRLDRTGPVLVHFAPPSFPKGAPS
ncbi:MAG: hypothetical protein MZV64_63945 [Ignavibacteriales bacterium]|nr:hypothetical protein [Ignavibacteriales bacterium]